MQSIQKMEETKLFGKQESPEIDLFSDTEKGTAAPQPDTKVTFQKTLQDEIAQNVKAEDPLCNEENVKNQLAMCDLGNNETKGEDEEELHASKALLQNGEMAPFLEDEDFAQSQTKNDVIETQEQLDLIDTQWQPVQTDIQEASVTADTQEQHDPKDTQEQQKPVDTPKQPIPTNAQQQTIQTDVHEIPILANTQQQPVPMEIEVADGNIFNANLEQEVIKEERIEIKLPEEQPVARDYSYRCRSCNQAADNLRELVQHRLVQHKVHPRPHLFKYLDLEPIVSDPDHYCRSCDIYFISRMRYRDHLESAHHMILKPLRRTTIVIDGDPKLYCEPCDKYLCDKYQYRHHLQNKHNIDLPPLKRKANPNITPDLDHPDFYCASCNYKYNNKGTFKAHCERIHKMQVPKKTRIVKEGTPDVHDPNNYCKVCEHTFASKQKYKRHLRNVHKMDDPVLRPSLLKRVSTPKYFCQTCNLALYKDSFYLRHLSLAHTVQVISLLHDADDTDSRADIIELIQSRKDDSSGQNGLLNHQSRLQTDTIDVESAVTEATTTLSENPKAIESNNATTTLSQVETESTDTPHEPVRLRPRAKKHVRFADFPSSENDGTPFGYGDSQTESDDYQPSLNRNDPLYSEGGEDHSDSDQQQMDSDEYLP